MTDECLRKPTPGAPGDDDGLGRRAAAAPSAPHQLIGGLDYKLSPNATLFAEGRWFQTESVGLTAQAGTTSTAGSRPSTCSPACATPSEPRHLNQPAVTRLHGSSKRRRLDFLRIFSHERSPRDGGCHAVECSGGDLVIGDFSIIAP